LKPKEGSPVARRFELVVFDWDGTLLDSPGAIVAAIQAAARDLDLPEPPDERARHVIGLGLSDALRHALPELPPERYGELVERYRYHYLSRDHELSLFAGVEALLQELADSGARLAVATGKSRLGLERALKTSGLGRYFEASRCADECHSKPHPQMLHELMDETFVVPERMVMVGDTTHDLLMAQNAGVAGLGVAWGAHPRVALDEAAPVAVFERIEELAEWLRTHG
jgi:phosphoglycolate phosphatase